MKVCDWFHTLNWPSFISYVVSKRNQTKQRSLFNHSPLEIVSSVKAAQNLKLARAYKTIELSKKVGLDPVYYPGDYVRIPIEKKLFDKSFLPAYSSDIYEVKKVIPSQPLTYVLKPLDGDRVLARRWYAKELSKVLLPQVRDTDDLKEAGETSEQQKGETEKQPKAEVEKQFYVHSQRELPGRLLRSGTSTQTQQQFELRDKKNPKFSKFVTPKELEELKSAGKIHPPPS